METAVGAASWLVGKVLNKLSDELVAAYVSSSELGLNSEQIKAGLLYTRGLLHEARAMRDDSNLGLKGLLEQLSEKADEADDALDELHYFMIQDKLDGTHHATPYLGGGLKEKIQHGCNAARHTIIGNWLSCFTTCCRTKGDAATTAVNSPEKPKPDSASGSGHVDKLTFDRVALSTKIKSVINAIHSSSTRVSDLLKIPSHSSTTGTTSVIPKRRIMGSTVVQDQLYGRTAIFEQTIKDITSAGETLSVLPIVGPGGIGKTTFAQHLYNDKRTKEHFTVRVWVCVSTEFDVLKLTQQIHSCIPTTEKEETSVANRITNFDQLQISITDRLRPQRFLIVLDDIWKCDSDHEWETLLAPFTRGEAKGSMVLVTTRFPKIEERVKKATIPVNLQGLDPKEFLKFFQTLVFGENGPDSRYNELISIGGEIAVKLKYSPLAAKTVARLLRRDLRRKHWRNVLENNEWKNQTHSDDIMPALKISYDYLPFHLKQFFSYFSLFPEDHKFTKLEITCFWTAIGIIDSSDKNNNYLQELVENGFLVKEVGEDQCYKMHDLMHELSQSVSSQVCANISSLSFSADNIPQSIQHLSITVKNRYDENFRKEMDKLKSRIKIKNLRTLMIFRGYEERIDEILKYTFEEIEGLHVLFIVFDDSPKSLPINFSKLVHLRYLKIRTTAYSTQSLPSTLTRFYHLTFLDLQDWHGGAELPEHFSRLVNLKHFIANERIHSNVSDVGKIEHLEELKEFHVKKRNVGFELEELGKLTDLGGQLTISNLQKVVTKEEAGKANLALKSNLKRLILVWGWEEPCIEAYAVDGLRPHDNLTELVIKDCCGSVGPPSWLFHDTPTLKYLEDLTLNGVSWGILPPLGQLQYLKSLWLENIGGVRHIELGSMRLKGVYFKNMRDLEEWTAGPNCQSFVVLERIQCGGCPKLQTLPFWSEYLSGLSCAQQQEYPKSMMMIRYPSLTSFVIDGCGMLSLNPMPHTPSLTFAKVSDSSANILLSLQGDYLFLGHYSSALAFHNMVGKVKRICFKDGSKIPWTDLQRLPSLTDLSILSNAEPMESMAQLSGFTSLTTLALIDCSNLTMDGFNPLTIVNLKTLRVYNEKSLMKRWQSSIAADLLAEMAIRSKLGAGGSFFHHLEELEVDSISGVLVAPICSLLSSTLRTLGFMYDCQRVEGLNEEEEKALQLLTSLRVLRFYKCSRLTSLSQGLHTLASLEELHVSFCHEIQSLPLLPPSLRKLTVYDGGAELLEQAKVLKQRGGTNLDIQVNRHPLMGLLHYLGL